MQVRSPQCRRESQCLPEMLLSLLQLQQLASWYLTPDFIPEYPIQNIQSWKWTTTELFVLSSSHGG